MREPTHGVVIGKVINVDDPEQLGRVQVRYPWLGDTKTEWVSVASIMAGDDRGAYFMPEIDDEALVSFEHCNWDHPFVVVFTWNQQQKPPSTDPRERMIRSKNGHTIRFIDSTVDGGTKGALVIEDAHGNRISMTNSVMRIHAVGHLIISADKITIMNGTETVGRPVKPLGGPI